MGKASTSKKVARAARAGGTTHREGRKFGYPLAIFAIIVIGTSLVVYARSDRTATAATAPQIGDHWHAAYGVYICDAFLPALTDQKEDKLGLHTHGDGIIHIHPFSDAVTGTKANLGNFGDMVGMSFTSDSVTVNGTTYGPGYDCNGQPASVKVFVWPADDPNAQPQVYTTDFGKVDFLQDRLAITIAVVPEGVVPPRPESVPTLDKLSDVSGSTASTDTTVAGASTSTTAAGDPDAGVQNSGATSSTANSSSTTSASTAP